MVLSTSEAFEVIRGKDGVTGGVTVLVGDRLFLLYLEKLELTRLGHA